MDKQKQFLTLYVPIHDKLSRYCLAVTGNESDAKDLQSETIMKAYEKFETIEKHDSFMYFLFRIAGNTFKNNFKRSKFFEKFPIQHANEMIDNNSSASSLAENHFLFAAINKLPSEQRDAIVMYEISGLKTEEIAKLQKCSPEAVRQRLVRGREKLKRLLGVPDKNKLLYSIFEPLSAFIISFINRNKVKPISDKELDQLFEGVRNIGPIISLDEVERITKKVTNTPTLPKTKFRFLKSFKKLIMSTFIISSITILHFVQLSDKNEIPSNDLNTVKGKQEIIKSSLQESLELNANIHSDKNGIIKNSINTNKTKRIRENIIQGLPNQENTINEYLNPFHQITNQENKDAEIDPCPDDTVIDGRKFIVYLADKELLNLGIYKDDYELYYNNKNRMSFSMIGKWDKKHYYQQKTNKQTSFDFCVEYRTDLLPNKNEIMMDYTRKFNFQKFYNENDTLVPVFIHASSLSNGFEDFICWFKATPDFFKVLPDKYKYLEKEYSRIKENKKVCKTLNNVIYFFPQEQQPVPVNLIENVPTLILSEEQLKRIGIEYNNMDLTLNSGIMGDFQLRKGGGSHYVGIRKYPVKITEDKVYPIQVSDVNGYKIHSWHRFLDLSDSLTKSKIKSGLDKLILVKVLSKDHGFKEDFIFWFIPTEKLLNSIGGEIGKSLKTEYEKLNIENQPKASQNACTYFEICRSTLNLDGLKIYPNPARDMINLEFVTTQNLLGKVSIVNIAGLEIRILENTRNFETGYHLLKLNISEIPEGIYLIAIYTDKGFRTQRILISK